MQGPGVDNPRYPVDDRKDRQDDGEPCVSIIAQKEVSDGHRIEASRVGMHNVGRTQWHGTQRRHNKKAQLGRQAETVRPREAFAYSISLSLRSWRLVSAPAVIAAWSGPYGSKTNGGQRVVLMKYRMLLIICTLTMNDIP